MEILIVVESYLFATVAYWFNLPSDIFGYLIDIQVRSSYTPHVKTDGWSRYPANCISEKASGEFFEASSSVIIRYLSLLPNWYR